jgi:hypothetical protein
VVLYNCRLCCCVLKSSLLLVYPVLSQMNLVSHFVPSAIFGLITLVIVIVKNTNFGAPYTFLMFCLPLVYILSVI